MRNWNVNAGEPCSVSVQTWTTENGYARASVGSASRIDDTWWVDRVKVHDLEKRKGLGSGIVGRLQAALVGRYGAMSPRPDLVLRVCPGGYNEDPEVQKAFYASCGFKVIEEDPYGGGGVTMEWQPAWQEFTKKAVG
jgi:hypothetical protein